MTDLETPAALAGALMILANFVVQQVAIAAAFGALGPNAYVGIRNDATRRSPTIWSAAHRVVLVIVGVGTVTGIGLSITAITLSQDDGQTAAIILVLSSAALLALTVVIAERRASRVATDLLAGGGAPGR